MIKLLAVVLAMFCLVGCGSSKNEVPPYEGRNTLGYGYMYDRIPDSNESYSNEEMSFIQKGILAWARGSLLLDNQQSEDLNAQSFDSLIVDADDRSRIQEDRANTETVQIDNMTVQLQKAVRTKYQDKEVGKVYCTIELTGQRNGQDMNRTYTLVLLIHYANSQMSIYEIGEIDFSEAGEA